MISAIPTFRRGLILTALFSLVYSFSFAQSKVDSVQKVDEIIIRAYLSDQPILLVPSSVSLISAKQLRNQPGISMLPALNSVPGIRMEERSPGSYRLSIRGSSLRSPFGVRNVKIYLDEFPLTDAGGNTYLNLIDVNSLHNMEVLKGPDGSLFGANSGGVVLLNPVDKGADSSWVNAGITSGSYGLFQEQVAFQKKFKNQYLNFNQSYQRSDGYREHSAMSRNFAQMMYRVNYAKANQLRVLGFYSDLEYKTPGGLTLAQYNANPRAARPSTAFVAGPVAQQARIENQTLYAGIVNEAKIFNNFKHVFAVYGSSTDYLNPFITNYEVRKENTGGIRTYFELQGSDKQAFSWKWNAGLELQSTGADIANYTNTKGVKGNLQAQDDIISNQFFYFTRLSANINKKLSAEAAVSLNYNTYKFSKDNQIGNASERKFDPEFMPRLALSYKLYDNLALRSSISRGYSPPTIAEVRASDNKINNNIEAETGWNYEAGLRLRNRNDRLWIDASIFQYRLENAIVRRVNADDTEFYLNAGGTRQDGIESQASYWLIEPGSKGMITGLQLQNSYTLSRYYFKNYINGTSNYSGNRLTGTPRTVIINGLDIQLQKNFYLFAQHNYTSKVALNDANSVFAKSFNLVHFKAGWRAAKIGKTGLDIFAGIDNLLNETYSLGNDLNAFGGRFFNAAAPRNFFGGMKVRL